MVSTLDFSNLKVPTKVRDSFVGPFITIKLIGKKAVKVRLTEELSRKTSVFPVILVKPYHQTEEDMIPLQEQDPHSTGHSRSGGLPWLSKEDQTQCIIP
ncbi:hypothetical protein O181_049406 [Austropuccinia psidii MF-1]|uniref:Uncharacterized protein n=1 Tax=Austropuccinia psidii MF-1 TaxID=1389203 RepID=A0A9Q3DZU6_9BASI|nr:hypothetical protein [Austropuccinia psidii MF-1]